MVENILRFTSLLRVYKDIYHEMDFKFFFSVGNGTIHCLQTSLDIQNLNSVCNHKHEIALFKVNQGNFGLFCSFSPKLPRIHVGLHCNANEKN